MSIRRKQVNHVWSRLRSAYDALGRLTHRWGSGTQPVKYVYDPVHGGMTEMRTFKDDTIPDVNPADALLPPAEFATATAAVTQWVYHPGTARLWKKIDATGQPTEYAYHPSGLLRERKWARLEAGSTTDHPTASYAYQMTTTGAQVPGRLTAITYSNDGDVTPDVNHSYRRDGRVNTTDDGAGRHTWAYVRNGTGTTSTDTISAVAGGKDVLAGALLSSTRASDGRVLSASQEAAGVRAATTHAYAGGRHTGGDFDQNIHRSGTGGFVGPSVSSHREHDTATGKLSIVGIYMRSTTNGMAAWEFDGAYGRDEHGRMKRILYSSTVVTGPDWDQYTTTPLMGWEHTEFDGAGRRKNTLPYLGAGVAHTSAEPPAWSYLYNARGEVEGASRFRAEGGANAVVGSQTRAYAYDGMGNRERASTGPEGDQRTTLYPQTNALNQYEAITHPRALEVSGTIASGFTPEVKVNGNVQTLDAAGTGEPGSFRAEATTLADGLWQRVEISATKVSTGETVPISDGHRYTPPANEAPDHDLDGNLTEDARWKYTWDAENRMIGAEEKERPVGGVTDPAPPARKRLTFAYDARHRRIAKTVHEWEGDAATGGFTKLVKDLRFLYDDWNMTVELDHTFATGTGLAGSKAVRAYYWGPDLSGTLQGAGGVGGLLAVCTPGGILLPCTDTNGNIKGLVSATDTTISGLTARYDYDPFGNRITDTGPGVELCPFSFSTKYRDEETGIIRYELRDYRPSDGRWMSQDRIGERGGINLYGMVGNDPVNHWDRLGLLNDVAVFADLAAHWASPNNNEPFVRTGSDWNDWMKSKDSLMTLAKSLLTEQAQKILNGQANSGYFRTERHTGIDSFLLNFVLDGVDYRIGGYAELNGCCVTFKDLDHDLKDNVVWHPIAHPWPDAAGAALESIVQNLWPGSNDTTPFQGFPVHIYNRVHEWGAELLYCKSESRKKTGWYVPSDWPIQFAFTP